MPSGSQSTPKHVGRPRHGQAIVEYVLLFAVVAAAIAAMQIYAKRGLQAVLKVAADDLSRAAIDPIRGQNLTPEQGQVEGMRQEAGESIVPGPQGAQRRVTAGSVIARNSSITTTGQSQTKTGATLGGGQFTNFGGGARTTTTGTSTATVISEVK